MLSLTMQFPLTSTASHGIFQPAYPLIFFFFEKWKGIVHFFFPPFACCLCPLVLSISTFSDFSSEFSSPLALTPHSLLNCCIVSNRCSKSSMSPGTSSSEESSMLSRLPLSAFRRTTRTVIAGSRRCFNSLRFCSNK